MFTETQRRLIRAATDAGREVRKAKAAHEAKPTKANADKVQTTSQRESRFKAMLQATEE